MKKLTYLLAIMFTLVLMGTSCEKDETVDPVTEQTSGELHPEYVGYWQNDKTTVDGKPYEGDFQYEFDIHDVKAEEHYKNNPNAVFKYDSWRIEGNQIIFYKYGYGDRKYTIKSEPANNKMILSSYIDGAPALFYLSIRIQ